MYTAFNFTYEGWLSSAIPHTNCISGSYFSPLFCQIEEGQQMFKDPWQTGAATVQWCTQHIFDRWIEKEDLFRHKWQNVKYICTWKDICPHRVLLCVSGSGNKKKSRRRRETCDWILMRGPSIFCSLLPGVLLTSCFKYFHGCWRLQFWFQFQRQKNVPFLNYSNDLGSTWHLYRNNGVK